MDDESLARAYGVEVVDPTPVDLVLHALEMAVRGDGASAGEMLENMSEETLAAAIEDIGTKR